MEIRVAPSIFAADFSDLNSAIKLFEKSNVDLIHYDVMDNHFVPNISFGPKFVADVSAKTNILSDVHLMINLEQGLDDFLELDIESITIHLEATKGYPMDYINKIKSAGKKVGISIKPQTPVEAVLPYLCEVNMVLLMSVEPGFSGQKFISQTTDRIEKLKSLIGERDISIQVDGGVSRETYEAVLEAGADCIVIGSAFFKDDDVVDWVKQIHSLG